MWRKVPSLSRRAARTEERQRLLRVAGSDLAESGERLEEEEVMSDGSSLAYCSGNAGKIQQACGLGGN